MEHKTQWRIWMCAAHGWTLMYEGQASSALQAATGLENAHGVNGKRVVIVDAVETKERKVKP